MKRLFALLLAISSSAWADHFLVEASKQAVIACTNAQAETLDDCARSALNTPQASRGRKAMIALYNARSTFIQSCTQDYSLAMCSEIARNLASAGQAAVLKE